MNNMTLRVPEPTFVTSRDNAFVKELRKLAQDNTAYRKAGRYWVEGEHLCEAALLKGMTPAVAVFSDSGWLKANSRYAGTAEKIVVLADSLFNDISALESPAGMGYLLALPEACALQPGINSVVLDRVQDAGNAGSILRSAAAFGFHQVIALKGTVAMWSPKVLRAGMGAHFGLSIVEGLDAGELKVIQVPLVVTSSHRGELIQNLKLPDPCVWAMGHEGQGVGPELMELAGVFVRIGQPGGEESLNVAAAAAICLHASSTAKPGANGAS